MSVDLGKAEEIVDQRSRVIIIIIIFKTVERLHIRGEHGQHVEELDVEVDEVSSLPDDSLHSTIGDHCFISSHVVISGSCVVGDNVFMGVNALCHDSLTIADECLIGAGAVISRDTAYQQVFVPVSTTVFPKTSEETGF